MSGHASTRDVALPSVALLARYNDGHSFTDSYVTEIDGTVPLAAFVEAFYTTWLFKLERFILTWLVRRPSTDEQARALAAGKASAFAAWRVENRNDHQLLMNAGRTCSWFMVEPVVGRERAATRLYFGSAVIAKADAAGGKPELGFVFNALLGFHKLYSRVLLSAARARLARRTR
ncbi:MAG: hypothetical protein SF172_13475 [Burkholderiales bacterium]|nr:hypothetical protein [Burkholderiales bacterium]